jgi:hypothetical protein
MSHLDLTADWAEVVVMLKEKVVFKREPDQSLDQEPESYSRWSACRYVDGKLVGPTDRPENYPGVTLDSTGLNGRRPPADMLLQWRLEEQRDTILSLQTPQGLNISIKLGELMDGGSITIGRGSQCERVVADDYRRHATISRKEDGALYIEDHSSFNGTYVNGRQIFGLVEFQPEDKISFGKRLLKK